MPRVSKVQTEANHKAIEDAASRLFRERGLHGVTVAEVMAEVGMTHGGFYAHYASKDALAASACATAFAFADGKWRRRIEAAATPGEARQIIAERYLQPAHRDPSAASCPTATLATDVARADTSHPIRATYIQGLRTQVETLAALGDSGDPGRDRADACVRLATMMGALLLARACHGDPLSDEIAEAARTALTSEAPARRTPKGKARRTTRATARKTR